MYIQEARKYDKLLQSQAWQAISNVTEEDSKKCTHQANLMCYTRLTPLNSLENLWTKSSNSALH